MIYHSKGLDLEITVFSYQLEDVRIFARLEQKRSPFTTKK